MTGLELESFIDSLVWPLPTRAPLFFPLIDLFSTCQLVRRQERCRTKRRKLENSIRRGANRNGIVKIIKQSERDGGGGPRDKRIPTRALRNFNELPRS